MDPDSYEEIKNTKNHAKWPLEDYKILEMFILDK